MSTTTAEKPDVNEMRVIHRVYRRELGALPELVRRVPDGDTERAVVVGQHAELVLTGLHIHHSGEDEHLWPLLLERAQPSTELVRSMQAQHERVHGCVDRCQELLAPWRVSADRSAGEQLAVAVEQLNAALVEPLAEEHVSVAEWAKLGEHGRDSMSRSQLPIMFGAILEEADPHERATMLALVPGPVRLFLRTLGARQYHRYISRVRAG
jgi:hemerythrin-like domain-containing protein